MALLRIPEANRTLKEESEIRSYLDELGIEYERVGLPEGAAAHNSAEELLRAFGPYLDFAVRRKHQADMAAEQCG